MEKRHLIMIARLNANISFEKLAKLCNMSTSNLYNIETGKAKKPKLDTLFTLSIPLNLDFKELATAYGYNFTEFTYTLTIARLNAGLSIKALAINCNMDFYHLCHILNAKRKPGLAIVYVLAKHLNLDFRNLAHLTGYDFSDLAYQCLTARLDRNLTLDEFASLLGISKSVLVRIEYSQVKKPTLKTLIALSAFSTLTFEDLEQLCGYKS